MPNRLFDRRRARLRHSGKCRHRHAESPNADLFLDRLSGAAASSRIAIVSGICLVSVREVAVGRPTPFSFDLSFAPVAWSAGRWPNEDWIDGAFWWVGRERGQTVWRKLSSPAGGRALAVEGSGCANLDAEWFARVCRPPASVGIVSDDPIVDELRVRYRGAWSFCYGSLFDGIVASIVGQSISLAAAGVTATRLAALFSPGMELAGRLLAPLPTAEQLADAHPKLIRRSGVTGKRAEALCAVGRLCCDENLPPVPSPDTIDALVPKLLSVSGIGPWTVASALLWGIAAPDAFPDGDVALLRAVRRRTGDPTIDMKGLRRRAASWSPYRGEVARLFWLDLLGPAPKEER